MSMCRCGCGEDAGRWTRTRSRDGSVAGEEREFLPYHATRLREPEYVEHPNGCWVAKGSTNGTGYVNAPPPDNYAHRRMYRIRVGPIPDGLELDHTCRNRRCCNPDHLDPVTHQTNARRGNQTKLTRVEVVQIKSMLRDGRPYSWIAEDFGVSPSCIAHISQGNSWKDVA